MYNVLTYNYLEASTMKLFILTLKAHISAPILVITYSALSAGNDSRTNTTTTHYSRLYRPKVDNSEAGIMLYIPWTGPIST